MKTLFFLCVLILIPVTIYSQNNVIEYDFKTGDPFDIEPAKSGKMTVIKIKNVNKFIYEAKITSKQSDYQTEPSPVFSQLFNIEQTVSSNIQKEANIVVKDQLDRAMIDSIESRTIQEKELLIKEESLKELKQNMEASRRGNDMDKIQVLDSQIQDLENLIKNQQEEITKIDRFLEDENDQALLDLYLKVMNVHNSYEMLEESKVLKNQLIKLSLTDGLDYDDYQNKADELENSFMILSNPEILLSNFNNSYRQFQSSYELYLVNEKVREKFSDNIDVIKCSVSALLAEIESLKSKVEEQKYPEIFEEIRLLFSGLRNRSNFEIISDPIQAKKDVINVNVSISPKENSKGITQSRDFSFEIPVTCGVKMDFSSGLFLTTSLYNRSYHSSVLASDTSMSRITENKNNSIAQISVGALMHISPKTKTILKPSFSFGLGINSTDISKANIFIGASLMIGREEKFVISSGISFAQVDYLKGRYSLNSNVRNADLDEELTEKSMRAGWFVSFTYNLTNQKRE